MTKTQFMHKRCAQKCAIFTWLPWCFLQVMRKKQEPMSMQKSLISQWGTSAEPGKQETCDLMLPRPWWCASLWNVRSSHGHVFLLYSLIFAELVWKVFTRASDAIITSHQMFGKCKERIDDKIVFNYYTKMGLTDAKKVYRMVTFLWFEFTCVWLKCKSRSVLWVYIIEVASSDHLNLGLLPLVEAPRSYW